MTAERFLDLLGQKVFGLLEGLASLSASLVDLVVRGKGFFSSEEFSRRWRQRFLSILILQLFAEDVLLLHQVVATTACL